MKVALRFAIGFLLAGVLCANSSLRVNFSQLSRLADRVVAGKITKITAAEDAQTGNIYSTVTMSVSQADPAQLAGREFTFRMIGGKLSSRVQFIADYPKLEVGNDVVLFLNAKTDSVYGPTVGLGQGIFYLQSDAQDGLQRVMDRFGHPVLGIREQKLIRGVTQTAPATPALDSATKPSPAMRVEDFFEQVRANRALGPLQGSLAQ